MSGGSIVAGMACLIVALDCGQEIPQPNATTYGVKTFTEPRDHQ